MARRIAAPGFVNHPNSAIKQRALICAIGPHQIRVTDRMAPWVKRALFAVVALIGPALTTVPGAGPTQTFRSVIGPSAVRPTLLPCANTIAGTL